MTTDSAPVDPTVLALLRDSAVGPYLDQPVHAVLEQLGLPPLPTLPSVPPAPGLPPLPPLDLHALFKPLTDLASSFGTGQLGAGGSVDPSQVLSEVSSVISTAMSLVQTGMQLLGTQWQGQGAQAAADKTAEATTDGAALAGQAVQMSIGTQAAAGSVATGSALMTAILAKLATSVAAATPALVTPFGQAFVLAMAAESLEEATAVTASTRAQLAGHSTNMMAIGQQVPITSMPSEASSLSDLGRLLQAVAQPLTAVTSLAPVLEDAQSANHTVQAVTPVSTADEPGLGVPAESAVGAPVVAPGLGGAVVGAISSTSMSEPPLVAWRGPQLPSGLAPAGSAELAAAEADGPGMTVAASAGGGQGPGYMPMGGASAAAGLARTSDGMEPELRNQLVTAQHSSEVVGELSGASSPVIGVFAAGNGDDESPDKALIL
ncbi:hypothetical protein [Nocardia sp. CDC160]|uniref:hypothetical protein n=1 Tax=Nocardia sp. CDC160 TaxID=3112166 RepID=UPI002DB7ABCE|nr:hypothetical protein [Nocardia sp. CDC160]MEC3919254.1 hypothetical protein [Nocardia sp. CDC160]